jgi:hypothetical protein
LASDVSSASERSSYKEALSREERRSTFTETRLMVTPLQESPKTSSRCCPHAVGLWPHQEPLHPPHRPRHLLCLRRALAQPSARMRSEYGQAALETGNIAAQTQQNRAISEVGAPGPAGFAFCAPRAPSLLYSVPQCRQQSPQPLDKSFGLRLQFCRSGANR